MARWLERFWMFLAWHVPRPLAYFCAVRVAAHATTGDAFDRTSSPGLTIVDSLERWHLDNDTGEARS